MTFTVLFRPSYQREIVLYSNGRHLDCLSQLDNMDKRGNHLKLYEGSCEIDVGKEWAERGGSGGSSTRAEKVCQEQRTLRFPPRGRDLDPSWRRHHKRNYPCKNARHVLTFNHDSGSCRFTITQTKKMGEWRNSSAIKWISWQIWTYSNQSFSLE